jgi:hypothetical protein
MNIYDPTFASSQVAEAAGMTPVNFRAYLARGHWRIIGKTEPASSSGKAEPAASNGKGHLFTIYDALGYALANQLVQMGVDPKVAFERAMFDFAHVGDGNERDPGNVFDTAHGRTWFVFDPHVGQGRCIATGNMLDPLMVLMPFGNRVAAAIVIDLNDLRDRVFHRLGLDARDYEG